MPEMREIAVALGMFAAGCGNNHNGNNIDAPSSQPDVPAGFCINMAGPPPSLCTAVGGTTVSVREIGTIPGSAILATSPPNDGRIFVVEQDGKIFIFENEVLKPDPFLDINSIILSEAPQGERGLLGLAFHPDYACNGQFFVWYTTATADVLERFTVSSDIDKADPSTGTIILSVPDPFENHNAGMLEFGSDGFLYISTGDGGSAGDPKRNAQAIDRTDPTCVSNGCEPLLGKILRLDVDHPSNGKPYGIPSSNAFSAGGGEPEILIKGMRNPWRWSFDSMTGDMWIADVGQDLIEELDVIPAAKIDGMAGTPLNMGWSQYEANSCYGNYTCSNPTCATSTCDGVQMPQFQHTHTNGWDAIIGGEVYRGACYPGIVGNYYFSDNGAGVMAQATFNPLGGTNGFGSVGEVDLAGTFPTGPSAIHADARGELYETTTGNMGVNGEIWHIEAGP